MFMSSQKGFQSEKPLLFPTNYQSEETQFQSPLQGFRGRKKSSEMMRLKKYKSFCFIVNLIINWNIMASTFNDGEGSELLKSSFSFLQDEGQPCLPFDIQSLKINYLPGKSVDFGDNLGVLCLIQAAQIQRLTELLDVYKIKFRQLKKCRISYEAQIKELTQRLKRANKNQIEQRDLSEKLNNSSEIFPQKAFINTKKQNLVDSKVLSIASQNENIMKQIDKLRAQNQIVKNKEKNKNEVLKIGQSVDEKKNPQEILKKAKCKDIHMKISDVKMQHEQNRNEIRSLWDNYQAKVNEIKTEFAAQNDIQTLRAKNAERNVRELQQRDMKNKSQIQELEKSLLQIQRKNKQLNQELNLKIKILETERNEQMYQKEKIQMLFQKEQETYKNRQNELEQEMKSLRSFIQNLQNDQKNKNSTIDRLNKQISKQKNQNDILRIIIEEKKQQFLAQQIINNKLEKNLKSFKDFNQQLIKQKTEFQNKLEKKLQQEQKREKSQIIHNEKKKMIDKMMINSKFELELIEEIYEEVIEKLQKKIQEQQIRIRDLQKNVADLQQSSKKKELKFTLMIQKKDAQFNEQLKAKEEKIKQKIEIKNVEIEELSTELNSAQSQNKKLKILIQKAKITEKMMMEKITGTEIEGQIKDEYCQQLFEKMQDQKKEYDIQKSDLQKKKEYFQKYIETKNEQLNEKMAFSQSLIKQLSILELSIQKVREKIIIYLRNQNIEVNEEVKEIEGVLDLLFKVIYHQQKEKMIKNLKSQVYENMANDAVAEFKFTEEFLEESYLLLLEDELNHLKSYFSSKQEKFVKELDLLTLQNTALESKSQKLLFQIESLQNQNKQLFEENKNAVKSYQAKMVELKEIISSQESKLEQMLQANLSLKNKNQFLLQEIESQKYPFRKSQSVKLKREQYDLEHTSSNNSAENHQSKNNKVESSSIPFSKNIIYKNQPHQFSNSADSSSSQEEFHILEENQALKDEINTKNQKLTETQTLFKQKQQKYKELQERCQALQKDLQKKQSQSELMKSQILMLKQFIDEQSTQVQRKLKYYQEELIEASTVGNQRYNSLEQSFSNNLEQVEKEKDRYYQQIQKWKDENSTLLKRISKFQNESEKQINILLNSNKEKQAKIQELEQNRQKELQDKIAMYKSEKQELIQNNKKLQFQVKQLKILIQTLNGQLQEMKDDQNNLSTEIKDFQSKFGMIIDHSTERKKQYLEIEEQIQTETKKLSQTGKAINSDFCKSVKNMKSAFSDALQRKEMQINQLQYSISQKDDKQKEYFKKSEEQKLNIDQETHELQRGIFLLEEQMSRLQQNLNFQQAKNGELEAQNEHYLKKIERTEKERDEIKVKQFCTSQDNLLLRRKINDLHKKIQEYQKEICLKDAQIQELREVLEKEMNKLFIEKQNSRALEQRLGRKIEEQNYQDEQFPSFISESSQKPLTGRKNISERELNRRITELEHQIKIAEREIDKARVVIGNKQEQIIKINQDLKMEKKKNGKAHQNLLKITRNRFVQEIQQQKKVILDYETRVTGLFGEFDRLQRVIDNLKREKAEHISKNNNLLRQLDISNKKRKVLQSQIDKLNLDLASKLEIERKQRELLQKITQQRGEIEILHETVSEKDVEINKLIRRIPHPYRI